MNPKEILGYWKRGKSQYWHIRRMDAVLINTAQENMHYDGDVHIFFQAGDSTVLNHEGRVKVDQKEFDAIMEVHITRLLLF